MEPDWASVQVQQVIREVLTEGPAEASAIAYRAEGLTTSAVREQLAVLSELSVVTCLTQHEPSVWMLGGAIRQRPPLPQSKYP